MAQVRKYQLRNGRFGRQVILEPPLESEAETESDDDVEADGNVDETISSSDDESSSAGEEFENISSNSSIKSSFRWGKTAVPEPNTTYTGSFQQVDNEIQLPIVYFRRIFDDGISDHIAHQTNLYSVQKNKKSLATDSDEIDRFLKFVLTISN